MICIPAVGPKQCPLTVILHYTAQLLGNGVIFLRMQLTQYLVGAQEVFNLIWN